MSEVLSDRYVLGRDLGTGGMARVVAAHDQLLDREVAVKLLFARSDASSRARFLQEARSAARLRHPDAVAVYDTGEHDGQPFIVMELIEGETLGDLLEREGALPIEDAVAITLGVLDVLAAAHQIGMIHRDVKPGNVLLPAEGGVKLADFGIAKAMDDASVGLTTTGAVVGTASYLAPELVEGGRASPASDVYSVGCLLFALLTGRPPFTGDSALAVAYAQRHSPVPAVEELRPDVPDDLRSVLQRALAKEPATRFADATQMRTALLGGEVAPHARPAPAPVTSTAAEPTAVLAAEDTPGARRSERRGLAGAVVGVLAVALVLGLAGWWLIGQFAADDGPLVDALPDDADPGDGEQPPATTDEDQGPEEGEEPDEAVDPGEDEDAAAGDDDPRDEEGAGEQAPAAPTTVDGLIAVLAAAPSGTYGEKHDDLLEDLVDLTREEEDRAKEAAELSREVRKWVREDDLDPQIGRLAMDILDAESGR